MIYKRYRMIETSAGFELWLWVMWIVGMVVVFGIASHAIGQLSAHDRYIHTIDAMVKQFEAGCEKPAKFKTVPKK